MGWHCLTLNGVLEHILVMWDKRVVEKMEDSLGKFIVACSYKNVMDEFQWAFARVYGPNLDRSSGLPWDEFVGLCNT